MLLKMASEFAKVARTDFPQHDWLRIDALKLRLFALPDHSLYEREVAAKVLLSETENIKQSGPNLSSLRDFLFRTEAYARGELGRIAYMRDDFTLALEHYAKAKELLQSLGETKGIILNSDMRIVQARARMPNVDTVSFMDENMWMFKEFYELSKQKFGGNSDVALYAGTGLSDALFLSQNFVACERQSLVNYEMSRQVHGKDHPTTIECKRRYYQCMQKLL
jgi:hypothetical protein